MKYIVLSLALLCAVGCGMQAGQNTEKPVVAVSILPLRNVVEKISDGDFEVISVVPPGANPEIYEPTAAQMRDVLDSELFFQVGLLDSERALVAGIENNAPDLTVVDLSADLPLIDGGSAHTADPHVWLSPTRMRTMVGRIAENLRTIQPDSAAKYERNRDALISSIDSLDRTIRNSFSELQSRNVLIYHPSLTYFADDYDLRQWSIESEGKEPSAAGMSEVLRQIREHGIHTMFYQKQLNPSMIEAISQEAGLRAVPFDPLAPDWLANLGTLANEIRRSMSDEE